MSLYRQKILDEMAAANLLQKTAHLRFAPEHRECPRCNHRLLVRKTRSRQVVILDTGSFWAEETQSYCPGCAKSPVFRSEELARLVAPGAEFGYDIMVHVGRATFQRYRTAEEIVAELSPRNVRISPSEVRVQAWRFVLYLAEAHGESQEALKALLNKQGGYILHLDSTCDGASSHLLSAMDGLSDLVLMSVKVDSEKADEIVPMLKKLKAAYGNPLAIVSDMSKAIRAAVKRVFKRILHCICHFHFLRDTGKDLLEPDYKKVRESLKAHGICALLRRRARELRAQMGSDIEAVESMIKDLAQGAPAAGAQTLAAPLAYSMIEWALAGKQQGKGYGFPFDLPLVHFYERLKILSQALTLFKGFAHARDDAKKSLAAKLTSDLRSVLNDQKLQEIVLAIHRKKDVFEQLRQAMRIARPDDKKGLNDDGENVDMPTIKRNVTAFHKELRQRPDFTKGGPWGKMAAQIKKYWKQLFADPIKVHTSTGILIIYPNRTNNLLERLFRALNRDHRRQTGDNSMRRRLNAMLGDTPLVKNLDNPTYMAILLDGSANPEERFARIDTMRIRQQMKESRQEAGRTLPGLRKIFSLPTWPLDVASLCIQARSG